MGEEKLGEAAPVTGSAENQAGAALGSTTAAAFGAVQTRAETTPDDVDVTDQDTVQLSPGESARVIEISVTEGTLWTHVGTTSQTFTLYDYIVDGDSMLEFARFSPFGTPGDRHQFAAPIQVDAQIAVEVTRESDATGNAEYLSEIEFIEG